MSSRSSLLYNNYLHVYEETNEAVYDNENFIGYNIWICSGEYDKIIFNNGIMRLIIRKVLDIQIPISSIISFEFEDIGDIELCVRGGTESAKVLQEKRFINGK